jgi:hypothetical protein
MITTANGTVGNWLARQITIEGELRPAVAELTRAGYPPAEIHAAIVRILEESYEQAPTASTGETREDARQV